jgi:hypothetical protein
MSQHDPKGFNIVRRLQTKDPHPAWPETIAVGFSLIEEGWGPYTEQVFGFMAEASMRALALLMEDKTVDSTQACEWNVGAWLSMYKKQDTIPSNPGVGIPGVQYILDETMFIEGRNGIGFEVVAYEPHAEDQLPEGVRLPMTEVEKLTHEVGRMRITIGEGPHNVEISGVFAEDKRTQELVAKVQS